MSSRPGRVEKGSFAHRRGLRRPRASSHGQSTARSCSLAGIHEFLGGTSLAVTSKVGRPEDHRDRQHRCRRWPARLDQSGGLDQCERAR